MSLIQLKSLVQFTRGTSLVWEALLKPVPAGVVSFSIDDGAFKLGDGVTFYTNLPTLFTFNELVSAQGGVGDLFKVPSTAQNGHIVVIARDGGTNKMVYASSNTTLAELFAALVAIESTNALQDVAVANILAIALSIDASINTGSEGNVIVIRNNRYSDSGVSLASIEALLSSSSDYVPGSHMRDIVVYSDSTKTNIVNKTNLHDNATYYVECLGFNSAVSIPTFGLTCSNAAVAIEQLADEFFSITFNNILVGVKTSASIVLIASVDDGTGNAMVKKAITAMIVPTSVLATIYGGMNGEAFQTVTVDSLNNIICAGSTSTDMDYETRYGWNAFVVKFDSGMNILARKHYAGNGDDYVFAVDTDSNDNIIIAGYTSSQGTGGSAYVVKFDPELNIIVSKCYGGTNSDYFYGMVVDAFDNIICVGTTNSTGVNHNDASIVKFDSNLNLLLQKRYSGTNNIFFNAVATDAQNNIICCGMTQSDGQYAVLALVVKFDSVLNVLARKAYGIDDENYWYYNFTDLVVDSSNNVICVGVASVDSNYYGSIVKFDTNLEVLIKKNCGTGYSDFFYGVGVDATGIITAVGITASMNDSQDFCLIVKFDSELNELANKRYGGVMADQFNAVAIDSFGSAICAGQTFSTTNLNGDALAVKFAAIPSGTFVGSKITELTLSDFNLPNLDSTIPCISSVSSLLNATLTVEDPVMVSYDYTLDQVIDSIV